MADSQWRGEGPVFTIDSEGRRWTLELDASRPGLWWTDGQSIARLLALDHLAAIGRRDDSAFSGPSLISFERYRGRVRATFAPRGWQGLTVRTDWGPAPDQDGFDLEIQVNTTSTNVFRRVEVAIGSTCSAISSEDMPFQRLRVEPRDRHAAALSYDGREAAVSLQSLITMPVPAASSHGFPLRLEHMPGRDGGRSYIEMVQPNDCARRIIGEAASETAVPLGIRYGLFGLDLEKGVVLRGRVRGIWVNSLAVEQEASRLFEAFLREPPALGP